MNYNTGLDNYDCFLYFSNGSDMLIILEYLRVGWVDFPAVTEGKTGVFGYYADASVCSFAHCEIFRCVWSTVLSKARNAGGGGCDNDSRYTNYSFVGSVPIRPWFSKYLKINQSRLRGRIQVGARRFHYSVFPLWLKILRWLWLFCFYLDSWEWLARPVF